MIKKLLLIILVITSNLLVAQGNGRGNGNSGTSTGNNGNGIGNTDPSNVFVGTDAGTNNTTGLNNVFVGASAGLNNTTGNGNVYIGNRAGETIQGDNKLFIHNDGSEIPLIYGDFATDQLGVNTNTIPDGYNFAVGGGAQIDGNLSSTGYGIFRGESVRIGKEWAPTRGQIEFNATDNILHTTYRDIDGIERHFSSFTADQTNIAYYDKNESQIFKISDGDLGSEKVYIHMPKPDSRIVVAGYGNYLGDQGHKFVVKDGTAMIENAIYTNGRIAIGTTEDDPGYALTVKGKVHVQEVKVDLLGVLAPDYVFKDDYKLRTLEEVQSYIDQEGHLPNIPSAKEMEKEGVNLKEMNMKLLEKVEELTLYTIAQEKAIKEQKEANEKLEERLQKLEKLLQQ